MEPSLRVNLTNVEKVSECFELAVPFLRSDFCDLQNAEVRTTCNRPFFAVVL
jgi:hypothetical protein